MAPSEPVPVEASPFSAYKRRAMSLSELLPRPRASSTKALASAFFSVRTRTTEKMASFRSQSENICKKTSPISGWRLPNAMKANGMGRSSPVAKHRFRWEEHRCWQHAQASFEYHGEDAGVASSYFHIVADGVSSPFSRNSLNAIDATPVSSAILSAEVVRCVQTALQELTSRNTEPIGQLAFEHAIVDAIKLARINCFQYRNSRLATTLVVSYFSRWTGKLLTFSLGDSKCVVVRQGKIVYETLAVLREFNVPTVVNLKEQILAKDYVVQGFALQSGDICLTFSDGLGDNVYKDDLLATVASCELDERGLQSVCQKLLNMSKMMAAEATEQLFPFATAAVVEYRERTLQETKLALEGDVDTSGADHRAISLELFNRHKGKETLDRHLMLRRPSRKHHYSLMQLKLMAEMKTKKPDDITLYMTRFSQKNEPFLEH